MVKIAHIGGQTAKWHASLGLPANGADLLNVLRHLTAIAGELLE